MIHDCKLSVSLLLITGRYQEGWRRHQHLWKLDKGAVIAKLVVRHACMWGLVGVELMRMYVCAFGCARACVSVRVRICMLA